MHLYPVVLFLISITLMSVMMEVSQAARGRSGGGSRGGSSGSRKSSGSKSSSGSGSKTKVGKYDPIKPTTVRSPVIVKQTKVGSRSDVLKRVLFGYVVYRYAFGNAPVYRGGYPMYGSYVTIPEKRAVRITYGHEEQTLLNDGGDKCLSEDSKTSTLREGIGENLVELTTTVKYKNGKTLIYNNSTISLEDIKEEDFEVITRARYNTTIVAGTSCTQVEKKQTLLNDGGDKCLSEDSKTSTLREGIGENLVELTTTVKYKNGKT
ncbi:unnamed protein product, partial [Porites evermanni]